MSARPVEGQYARVVETRWIGPEGLEKLQKAKVAVLGLGNVGGQAAYHLGLLGIHLILVDRDEVKPENLGTQGFAAEHLGLPKVVARSRTLSYFNPSCQVEAIHADIETLGMGVLRNADIVFCCLDSRGARIIVNEMATRLGTAWVDTAVDGSGTMMFGRVAAYDTLSRASACYLCPHDGGSLLEIMNERAAPGCPVWNQDSSRSVEEPTLAISALGGTVASVAAVTGLKILLGKGAALVSRETYIDLDRSVLSSHLLKRNPKCLSDHRAYALTPVPRKSSSVAETFHLAGRALGGDVFLQLQRRSLVCRVRCATCGRDKRPYQLLETLGNRERTCRCGALMQPAAIDLMDRFSWEQAAGFRNRTWKKLGLPPEDVVVASRGDAELALLLP